MSGEGDTGDSSSSSDFSAKPSTSSNSRRITRNVGRNVSVSASASGSSFTRGVALEDGSGTKKKRRIVMRIEFDDDSDESSSSSNSSDISDDATNNRRINRSAAKLNNSTKTNDNVDDDDDDIKPTSSSRRLRGKVGKKANFVFSSDEDDSDEPVGGIRRPNLRNRQRLEDDEEEKGDSSNSRETKNLKNRSLLANEAPSTSQQQNEENGFNSDSSSNELLEKCPICLLSFRTQEIGSPATCQHIFCANCIEAWSKNVQTCPIDRIQFDRIIVRESYENRALVREINVCKTDCSDKLNNSEDDITHCEVCNRPDREDVMLLCDSCNQGYHIDCLTPALSEIPEGSWYCDNCFDSENEDSDLADDLNELYADIRDMGIPEARLRVTEVHQPRILRTRQNERIRAAILSRTRSSTRNQNIDAVPTTSSRAASTSSRSVRTVRKSSRSTARVPKTRRRRRRRARQRTYVVEYDLNNYDEKFAIKTTKRVIRRRRRKRTRRATSSRKQKEVVCGGKKTASKRLAEQLGVLSTNRETRAAASSQTFSFFGGANDLEYFSDSDDGRIENQIEIDTGGGGSTAVQTSVRVSSFRTHRGKKGLLSRLERETPSSTPDLLSNIMDLQDRWHNASRHMDAVRIGQDGSLNLPQSSTASGPSPQLVNQPLSATTTQPSNIETNQAPMYPRGGGNNRSFNSSGGGSGGNSGGGNYNNRYNNQSNYHGGGGGGGGGSSSSGGSSFLSSFGGSTGSGLAGAGNLFSMVGRGNFSFSSQTQNDNSNNNAGINRDRFNQLNNNNRNNQRNSLPLFNNNNNQSNDNSMTINQTPLQQHRQQNLPSMQNSQNNVPPPIPPFQNHHQPNLGLGAGSMLQQPPPTFTSSLPPPPIFGPHNQPLTTMLTQPPPIVPMLQPPPVAPVAPVIPLMSNPISAPPLLAPPAFNDSLFQLTAGYDNDDDDDSNCPNFSVYSMQSLQVANSDVRATAESKSEAPKEDDENEDLVQLSDNDEDMGTNKDFDDENDIPLPPSAEKASDAAEQAASPELYEPDQPTLESGDEDELEIPIPNDPGYKTPDNDDEEKNQSNDDTDSQTSPVQDMDIESQGSTGEKKTSSETSQVDENEEAEKEKNNEEVASLSEIRTPQSEPKTKRSKGVLELYDDSDWEELNMERPNVDDYQIKTPPLQQSPEKEKEKEKLPDDKDGEEEAEEEEEEIRTPTLPRPSSSLAEEPIASGDKKDEKEEGELEKEQDRSYTPCLDEKNEEENDGACTPELVGPSTSAVNPADGSHTPDPALVGSDAAGIAGMETELISEDEGSDKRDKSKRSKATKDKEQFKKISKNQKDRNYRTEKAINDNHRRSKLRRRRFRSRSLSNDKENQGMFRRGPQRGGRFKRREIPRYNVRNVVNNQRSFKDRYGRDTSRPARSTSRIRRRRSFSRSVSRSRSRSGMSSDRPSPAKRLRRSFSMSPTPPRHMQRRQSMSPRRRSRSPIRRSPIRRLSRTPLRIRSRSNTPVRRNKHKSKKAKRSISPVNRSRSLSRFTPRLSRSRTPPRHKPAKKPKDRKKKKKKRQASPTPRRESSWTRAPSRHRDSMPPTKRKRHHTPKGKSPIADQGWSPSPSPPRNYMHDNISWTPPLMSPAGPSRLHRNDEYNEFPITSKPPKEKRKREKKKKKTVKRRQEVTRKEKRRREPGVLSQAAPSKEVFASGSNILVSVSFNKDGTQPQQHTVVTLPPTREEVVAGMRGRSNDHQIDLSGRKKKRKDGRKRKKLDTKPIAIIDLERSPFQVTQENTDVIVLTDSECNGQDDEENVNISRESGNAMMVEMDEHEAESHRTNNSDKTPPLERLQAIMEESYANAIMQQGPKTPPEPQGAIKFNLINKNKQKQIRNTLHASAEESDEPNEEERQEDREPMVQSANKIGPNTPPESGPCSPDVYDPFDPTKSPSMSPRSPTPPLDVPHHEPAPDNEKHSTEDLRTETRMTVSSGGPVASEKNTINPVDLVMALMNTKANAAQDMANKSNESQYNSNQVLNLIDENNKPEENSTNLGITVLSNVILSSGKNQHIPVISSPPLSKSSSNMPPKKVTNILSNLPGLGNRHNGDLDAILNDIESPYSPDSADYEDLFEPPPDTNGTKRRRAAVRKPGGDVFENLFGSSPPLRSANARKLRAAQTSARNKFKTIVKVQKVPGNNNDEHVKVYDDLPNSAVELQVKDKFLRKLNRQERVVEEVKMVLKPRFNRKQISKEDYKEIMRRAVPKICHSRSGEINPKKIKNLIEAYVKKFRLKHKKLNIPNTGQVSSAVKCAAYLKKL